MPPHPRDELTLSLVENTTNVIVLITYYQMHWRKGISRLVYQKPVMRVSPLVQTLDDVDERNMYIITG
jgi:hypothetical protein